MQRNWRRSGRTLTGGGSGLSLWERWELTQSALRVFKVQKRRRNMRLLEFLVHWALLYALFVRFFKPSAVSVEFVLCCSPPTWLCCRFASNASFESKSDFAFQVFSQSWFQLSLLEKDCFFCTSYTAMTWCQIYWLNITGLLGFESARCFDSRNCK